jgi:hypothetical protein
MMYLHCYQSSEIWINTTFLAWFSLALSMARILAADHPRARPSRRAFLHLTAKQSQSHDTAISSRTPF